LQFFPSAHSFLAPNNAFGFSAGDVAELSLVGLLIAAFQLRRVSEGLVRNLAARRALSLLFLVALPVLLRLALLPLHPVPTPQIYDEFSHLLVADTLRHFRLANPPHPLPRFFETFFVIQRPSYSSIYPLGQGLALAIGWVLFGSPWAGVILSVSAFCALAYWMLRGWTSPAWAFVGGLLAVIEFGPLSDWMNSYWGGAVAAAAGCLVFGALPRLRSNPNRRNAMLMGAGIGLHLLTRPYETVFLVASVVLFFLPELRNVRKDRLVPGARLAVFASLALCPAIALTLAQNKQVTGRWLELPYQLSQIQYGVPTSLTFQPNPTPTLALTREQHLEYIAQRSFHGEGKDTLKRFFLRLEYRVRFARFFFLPPLYIALLVFLATIRTYRDSWVVLTIAFFALGSNFFPFFFPRYVAAETCLFLFISVAGLQRLSRIVIHGRTAGRDAATVLLALCLGMFSFWYVLHLFDNRHLPASLAAYETWDRINGLGEDVRATIYKRLAAAPGQQLVFVRYSSSHIFQDEWVYNAADIDHARVVWARDLGAAEDEKLRQYYSNRNCWLLDATGAVPVLTRFPAQAQSSFLDVP
jgi:hypothetical protein